MLNYLYLTETIWVVQQTWVSGSVLQFAGTDKYYLFIILYYLFSMHPNQADRAVFKT